MNLFLAKSCKCLLLVGLSWFFTAGPVGSGVAQDWPGWRGADRSDRSAEKGLLQDWPEEGPPKIWTNDTAGLGYGGFAVVNNRLYTMGLEDDQEFALCLDADTGRELWRTPVGARYENGWGDGPRSSPSVEGEFAWFLFAGGDLACLKTDSGDLVWKRSMQEFGGRIPDWGYSESPLIDGDQLVCTPGGKEGAVLAVHKKTGEPIWQSTELTQRAHYSSVIVVQVDGQKQYVQLLLNDLVGLDPASGKVIWKSKWLGKTAVIPTPVDVQGNVYITSGYGAGSSLVDAVSTGEAKVLWKEEKVVNHHGGIIFVDGWLYGHSDAAGFVCQSIEDGSLKWNNRKIGKGCVTWADGRFYHVEEDSGNVLLIEANPTELKLHGKFTMDPQTTRRSRSGKIWVHPVIAGGRLFVRDQEYIHCYDLRDVPAPVSGDPAKNQQD